MSMTEIGSNQTGLLVTFASGSTGAVPHRWGGTGNQDRENLSSRHEPSTESKQLEQTRSEIATKSVCLEKKTESITAAVEKRNRN
ncbi:unnamed protein product [Linum trigynum]|uniref:Uncharacterized protein n=1 Tax=Linum trigynum TaxID=586398 RepID=A0AAV2FZJ6_9ROSI